MECCDRVLLTGNDEAPESTYAFVHKVTKAFSHCLPLTVFVVGIGACGACGDVHFVYNEIDMFMWVSVLVGSVSLAKVMLHYVSGGSLPVFQLKFS